ncbi:MAG TPA: hypothetical protein VJ723_01300 [Candidatus Angelobacter sp.]|nr:hypothetical protein [Candidatus Angelobacter sp.]
MIASVSVLLPFALTIPEDEQFPVQEYDDHDCVVRVCPPVKPSQTKLGGEDTNEILLDDVPTFQTDVLRLEFQKPSFRREQNGAMDPSPEFIGRTINSFLTRLRTVARAGNVRPLDFPLCNWRLQYLNDDRTELEKTQGLVRGHGGIHVLFNLLAVKKEGWAEIQGLGAGYEPLPWDELLIEAESDLLRVGPAVVLAATALEVFIAQILDKLAACNGVPAELWGWVTDRGNYELEPTVEEQYDKLLKFLTGHSLKEEKELWDSFKNLKTARNRFVHEGTAKVAGSPVSVPTAQKLVLSAKEIVSKVREWLPEELQWPVLKVVEVNVKMRAKPGQMVGHFAKFL